MSNAVALVSRLSHTGPGAAKQLIARDRARAQKLLAGLHPHGPKAFARHGGHRHGHRSTGQQTSTDASTPDADAGVDVTDAGVTYTASVGVGSPATDYTLLIDTGSSNTWVGASQKYVPTSTSTKTGHTVKVSYGSGSFSGNEYTDTVTISPGLVIQNQSIGVATTATGFSGVDGILGIGPVDLTSGTVSGVSTVPTVTDNLFSQGTISSESIGISFEPTTGDGSGALVNGELTFGGTDSTKYTGEINFVPITSTSPASEYWGIDQSVT